MEKVIIYITKILLLPIVIIAFFWDWASFGFSESLIGTVNFYKLK